MFCCLIFIFFVLKQKRNKKIQDCFHFYTIIKTKIPKQV